MIVSCSEASNTGYYANMVARILAESGQLNLICLPKVAIKDEKLFKNLKNTSEQIYESWLNAIKLNNSTVINETYNSFMKAFSKLYLSIL